MALAVTTVILRCEEAQESQALGRTLSHISKSLRTFLNLRHVQRHASFQIYLFV